MSVVVMGMDYPEHCIECKFKYNGIHDFCIIEERDFDDEDCNAMERNDWHPDWCPIRPLPEKHGDLVDISQEVNIEYFDDMNQEWSWKAGTVADALVVCEEFPTTIVEEEE